MYKGHVQKKIAFVAGHSAKALAPPPYLRNNSDLWIFLKKFCIDIYVYVFGTSKLRHGKCPLKKFIYIGNWKLEKPLFERHQNNTAMGVDYLKKTHNFYTVFHFKKVPL